MVVAAAIYLLNFYSGSSLCPVAVWIIIHSGLRSRRKNDTVPVPSPELLVSMSVALASELSFFMDLAPAPASVRFHTLVFYCLASPQVEWKMN